MKTAAFLFASLFSASVSAMTMTTIDFENVHDVAPGEAYIISDTLQTQGFSFNTQYIDENGDSTALPTVLANDYKTGNSGSIFAWVGGSDTFAGDYVLTMAASNGAAFALHGLSLGKAWYENFGVTEITMYGTKANGDMVNNKDNPFQLSNTKAVNFQAFEQDWSDLSYIMLTGSNPASPKSTVGWGVDDIKVSMGSTPVSAPATFALLGLGLAGLSLMRRKG